MEDNYNMTETRRRSMSPHVIPNGVIEFKEVSSDASLNLAFVAHTRVSIETHQGNKYEGLILDNRNCYISDCITIYNVLDTIAQKNLNGHYTFFKSQIKSVKPVDNQKWPHDPNSLTFSPIEKVMDTVLVTSKKDLDNFIASLTDVKEIGCYLEIKKKHGEHGRFGKCECILMNVKNVLVVIDVEYFPTHWSNQLWTTLKKSIFENQDILKVFFDSTHASDYLYHKRSILLGNTYDLKIIYNQLIAKIIEPLRNCSHGPQSSLSQQKPKRNDQCDLWELFLTNSVPLMEYGIMEDHPQGLRGVKVQRKKFILKVKYLLLLKDEMQKAMLQPVKFLMESRNHMII